MTEDIRVALRSSALNGESPVWNAARQRLFWIDVRSASFHEFDPATGDDRFWGLPAWIGCYGLTTAGAVVALRTGLFHLTLDNGELAFLAPPPYDPRRFFFNDGRCDPRGRFFTGTMYMPLAPGDQNEEAPKGTPLWCYAQGARWKPMTPDVQISNGSAFSPDGNRLYHSDTKQKKIWVWDYDFDRGIASGRRVFADLSSLVGEGGPDGANVDRDGFYWCAIFGHGKLHRYDPTGRLEREVALPVRYPSMPAFGGPDRKTLFVTSAAWPVPAQERARSPEGNLLALEAPVPGLEEPRVGGL